MADRLETHRWIELEQVQCSEKINEKIVKRRMKKGVGKGGREQIIQRQG